MNSDGLTEYERERAENIRKNAELLSLLNVEAIHDDMGIPAPVVKGKGKAKARSSTASSQPRIKKERDPDAPLRRSTRHRASEIDPNESPSKKRKREAEEQERKEEEAREREEEKERQREARKARHRVLALSKMTDQSPEDLSTLNASLSALCSTTHAREIGSHTTARDDELKTDSRLTEVRTQAKKAVVRAMAKVTGDRVYCMAYHPEKTKDIIFFGDKQGQVGIWDPLSPPNEADEDEGEVDTMTSGRFWQLQMHWPATSKSSISAMKVDPIDGHSLITSAYDCTMRQTSFVSGLSREIFKLDNVLISGFDLPTHGNEVWVSDVSGCISHVDLREDVKKARRWDINGDGTKIGSISVNPVASHFLVTASNNRAVKLWDARKLSSLPVTSAPSEPSPKSRRVQVKVEVDADEPLMRETEHEEVEKYLDSKRGKGLLRGVYQHDLSASSAYWDPSGRRIVSTSYDNNLRVWDIRPSTLMNDAHLPNFNPISRRKHNCQTGRWLTILRAQWMPSPDVYPHFVVADMDHSLDVIGFGGDEIAKLRNSSRITAVQAVVGCHPSIVGRYATGNASGRCVLWAPSE